MSGWSSVGDQTSIAVYGHLSYRPLESCALVIRHPLQTAESCRLPLVYQSVITAKNVREISDAQRQKGTTTRTIHEVLPPDPPLPAPPPPTGTLLGTTPHTTHEALSPLPPLRQTHCSVRLPARGAGGGGLAVRRPARAQSTADLHHMSERAGTDPLRRRPLRRGQSVHDSERQRQRRRRRRR